MPRTLSLNLSSFSASLSTPLHQRPATISLTSIHASPPKIFKNPFLKSSCNPPKFSLSVAEMIPSQLQSKPSPAEVSRTIMELSSQGTLSILTQDGCPLGIGVRFVVDSQGIPVLCLNPLNQLASFVSSDKRSSLHVQLGQSGSRTPQCTLQGLLLRPQDEFHTKKLQTLWKKKFGEEVDEGVIHIVSVDQVLHLEDFKEDCLWVTGPDYRNAVPDPLRDCAGNIVNEMNDKLMEDVLRFCDIFVDLDFQVKNARMVWIDRLGFDVRILTPQMDVLEVRIPFPREVTDEKGAKSSLTCMSQLAWEVEKNYSGPEFEKVKCFKKLR
ncbi:hypothetical protein AMTRI_Chr12g240490 [Amborella trichopoda]